MNAVLEFLTDWSPHIWLFASIFGALMSGTLFDQSVRTLIKLEGSSDGEQLRSFRYWRRHSGTFFALHLSFVVVGMLSVLEVRAPWASLVILAVLLAVPLVLVWRSYDSLRFMGGRRGQ